MKNILLLVHGDTGLESRVRVALDLTRSLNAHLTCVDLTIPTLSPGADPLFGAMLLEPETRGEAQTAARERVECSGLPFQWVERHGDLGTELARFASFADMVVLSSPKDVPFPDMHRAIGDFLLKAKKPVLVVPASTTGIAVNGQALLLWDGSDQASAAMRAAMPLFRRAASVTILEIDDGSLEIPATVAATHLSQHGITSSVRRDGAFGEKTGRVILEQIELLKPAYAVMGGFGRSRLVESLFGGVTERLLTDSPVPLFLKH